MADGIGVMAMRSPFTVSQWQELEHQALIFKYMIAGLPVPPELLLPVQKSFESISNRFFNHPTVGYYSLYGKKVDPEPGRCRRTDGKKWRCSKDAYPDSKYCERHMHRGRNRSRKPVESHTVTQSSSLTITDSNSGTRNFQNLPLHDFQGAGAGTNQSHYQMDSIPYAIPSRYVQGLKHGVGEHSFFSGGSGSNKGLHMESQLEKAWPLMQSRVSCLPVSKSTDNSTPEVQGGYNQRSFLGAEFATGEPVTVRQDGQPLRPFLDEWPKTRDSWSSLEDDRSNQTSFSTTQLSISIPMTSSDFSTPSSRSLQDN
ncbi:hypothetical protein K2173_012210 [Erythroxylum novogranatense]|uniref:Growth-regulating factor n=1 Tax=Erythroxylum novogranatense TaxID=1862640 RepID=A0AAV8T7Y2_9ROSI|nr:hypothetical protein K2173_012210 [Erythroxylum novogranatense]